MSIIQYIRAREVLDSRGWPTIEVDVTLNDGSFGRASVPSGASVGQNEAYVMRDVQRKDRYSGRGVARETISHFTQTIVPVLEGMDALDQRGIDATLCALDEQSNKKKLGANCTLAVSLAVAKAQSQALKLPLYRYIGGITACVLPTPMMNILNGGLHAHNGLAIQEFMIVPLQASSFAHALQKGVSVFHALGALLKTRGQSVGVGDEGGFAPHLTHPEEAIELILEAIVKAGYKPGVDIVLALDAAASTFYQSQEGNYILHTHQEGLNREQMVLFWEKLIERYPIISLEDPMAEDDGEGWVLLTQKLGQRVQIVGDDIFVTQAYRLKAGIEAGVANAILIKPNQVGTLTETLITIQHAQQSGYACILSHRSGETEDTTLADLAVATNCGQIKTGAPSRSERVGKYNQLLRIEEQMAQQSVYAGQSLFALPCPA